MKKLVILTLFAFALTGCEQGKHASTGFSLPEGDAKRGEQVFLSYDCLACHTLAGYEDPERESLLPKRVPLGGDRTRITTYAELVTSVINPSHKLAKSMWPEEVSDEQGQSLMTNFNDVMTVTELTDLVTFLQPQYKLKAFNRTNYPNYFP
ncbi:c-type cytochrome [Aliiglaciecola sp. CAU 1673]|uniref:c-type cytochrome n=1 Tax=Aliiglaciecola sp. CAU 1673 TaxID=3032595 RepID=UPI0023DBE6F8|nr:c-type cytochrome [Aliiglaciecola sp. CAU 1673]MDF2178593.1 c-type cytochrome [Aliiglaciecola sp. CAU 1673]